MSIALLPFSIGQNVRVLALPVTKANDSFALTAASAAPAGGYNFAGRVETVGDEFTLQDTNLTPMDVALENPVTMGVTATYSLTEFESPANPGVNFGTVPVNVLKSMLTISYYAIIATQLGVMLNGIWTPKTQDVALVKFQNSGRNTSRDSSKRTATFVLVPYVVASTGTFGFNPVINDTTNFNNPFNLILGN